MAKLKLWVKNLIISIALVISLAGVGVGIYFMVRPGQAGPTPEPARELTPQQKEFINKASTAEQADVSYAEYEGFVFSNGDPVDLTKFIGKYGDYYVIENAAGTPEFYSYAMGTPVTSASTTSLVSDDHNITLTKVEVVAEYQHISSDSNGYMISGDFALVETTGANEEIISQYVVNLKNGQTVLSKEDFNEITIEAGYVGTTVKQLKYFGNNYLIADIIVVDEVDDASLPPEEVQPTKITYKTEVYNLAHPENKLVFDKNNALISYEITDAYAMFVGTANTTVYSSEFVKTMEFNNTAVASTNAEETIFSIDNVGDYKALTYYTVQFLDGGYTIVEENHVTTEEQIKETAIEKEVINGYTYVQKTIYNAVKRIKLNNQNELIGVNYTFKNSNGDVVNFDAQGVVTAKKSAIDGYLYFTVMDNANSDYSISEGTTTAYYYDYEFNFIISYMDAGIGEIVYYTSDTFVTKGIAGSSSMLNVWGGEVNNLISYEFIADSVYNDYIVIKTVGGEKYGLYNIATNQKYLIGAAYASKITNGKIVMYKSETIEATEEGEDDTIVAGFYFIDLDNALDADGNLVLEPIYNLDTSDTSINLMLSSAGVYVQKVADNNYTINFISGKSYTQIKEYSTLQIGEQIFVTMTKQDDSKIVIAVDAMDNLSVLTHEEIEEKYLVTITEPANTTSASFEQKIAGETNVSTSSGIEYAEARAVIPDFNNVNYLSGSSIDLYPTNELSYRTHAVSLSYTTGGAETTPVYHVDVAFQYLFKNYGATNTIWYNDYGMIFANMSRSVAESYIINGGLDTDRTPYKFPKVYSMSSFDIDGEVEKVAYVGTPYMQILAMYIRDKDPHYQVYRTRMYIYTEDACFIDRGTAVLAGFNASLPSGFNSYSDIRSNMLGTSKGDETYGNHKYDYFYATSDLYKYQKDGSFNDFGASSVKPFNSVSTNNNGSSGRLWLYTSLSGSGHGDRLKYDIYSLVYSMSIYYERITFPYYNAGDYTADSLLIVHSTGSSGENTDDSFRNVLTIKTVDDSGYSISFSRGYMKGNEGTDDETYSLHTTGGYNGDWWHIYVFYNYLAKRQATDIHELSVEYSIYGTGYYYGRDVYVANSNVSAGATGESLVTSTGERTFATNTVFLKNSYGYAKSLTYGDFIGQRRTSLSVFYNRPCSQGYHKVGMYYGGSIDLGNTPSMALDGNGSEISGDWKNIDSGKIWVKQVPNSYSYTIYQVNDGTGYTDSTPLPNKVNNSSIQTLNGKSWDSGADYYANGKGTKVSGTYSYNTKITMPSAHNPYGYTSRGFVILYKTGSGAYLASREYSANESVTIYNMFPRDISGYYEDDTNALLYIVEIYQPVDVTVSINTKDFDAGYSLYSCDGSNFVAGAINKTVTYHSGSFKFPLMYVSNGVYYYSVHLTLGGRTYDLSENKATIDVTYANISNIEASKGYKYTQAITPSEPLNHAFIHNLTIDSHVYDDATEGVVNTDLRTPEVSVKVGDNAPITQTKSSNVYNQISTNVPSRVTIKLTYGGVDTNKGWHDGLRVATSYDYVNLTGTTRFIVAYGYKQNEDSKEEILAFFNRNSAEYTKDKIYFLEAGEYTEASISGSDFKISATIDANGNLAITLTAVGHGRYYTTDGSTGSLYGDNKVESYVSTKPYENNVVVTKTGESGTSNVDGAKAYSASEGFTVEGSSVTQNAVFGYGSTLLVDISNSIFKDLYHRYAVANQLVTGFDLSINGKTYSSANIKEYFTAATFNLLRKNAHSGSDYTVSAFSASTGFVHNNLLIANGTDANKICRLLSGKNNLSEAITHYAILPVTLTAADNSVINANLVFIICHKGTGSSVSELNNASLKFALMFNIYDEWVTTENTDETTYNQFSLDVKYEDLTGDFSYSLVKDASSNSDAEISIVKAYEYASTEFENGDTKAVIDNGNITGSGTKTFETFVSPSNYFEFEFVAPAGHYFSQIDITYNGNQYRLTMDDANMQILAKDDSSYTHDWLKFVYKITKNGVDITDQLSGNTFNTLVDDKTSTFIRIDEVHLLDFIVVPVSAAKDSACKLILGIGGLENQGDGGLANSMTVSYAAFTLLETNLANNNNSSTDESTKQTTTINEELVITKPNDVDADFTAIDVVDSENHVVRLTAWVKRTITTINYETQEEISRDTFYYMAYNIVVKGVNNANNILTYIVNTNANATSSLYWFVPYISTYNGSDNSIEISSCVGASYIYEFAENIYNQTKPEFNQNRAVLNWDKDNQTQKLEITDSSNNKNLVALLIKDRQIDITVISGIDYGNNIYETENFEATSNSYNNYGEIDAGNVDKYYDYGQVASEGTTFATYANQADFYSEHLTTDDYSYGNTYKVYGNTITFSINSKYGYEFESINLIVTYSKLSGRDAEGKEIYEGWNKTFEYGETTIVSGEDPQNYNGRMTISWHQNGNNTILTLLFKDVFIKGIDAKINYTAKEFDIVYNGNHSFGSSAESTLAEKHTFVYNVRADIDLGTYATSETKSSEYTRIGYNQVGWAFDTTNFGKNSYGRTENIYYIETEDGYVSPYNNGYNNSSKVYKINLGGNIVIVSLDGNFIKYISGTLPDGYIVEAETNYIKQTSDNIYLTKYKVSLVEQLPSDEVYQNSLYVTKSETGISADPGRAWYLSLGESYANVFGTNVGTTANPRNGAVMYAIYQAKTYTMMMTYNDATENDSANGINNGSTTANKFYVAWVFDAEVMAEDIATGSVNNDKTYKFDVLDTLQTNTLSRVYRMGYTFEGWYYDNLFTGEIYIASHANETKLFDLDDTLRASIEEKGNWNEGSGEYYFDVTDGIHKYRYNDISYANDRITIYASWTNNTYTFEYDLNSAAVNDNYGGMTLSNGTITKNGASVYGSTAAEIDQNSTGILSVTFDKPFATEQLTAFKYYAFRDGYKFLGWFATRDGNNYLLGAGLDNLLENSTLNQAMLIAMLNNYSSAENNAVVKAEETTEEARLAIELSYLINKVSQTYENVNIVDTLTVNGENNKILVHARWQNLIYKINIDLNNWAQTGYDWPDIDYRFIDQNVVHTENSETTHNVLEDTRAFITVTFDKTFEYIDLWIYSDSSSNLDRNFYKNFYKTKYAENDLITDKIYTASRIFIDNTEVQKNSGLLRVNNIIGGGNTLYAATADNAYDVFLQLFYSYGYYLRTALNDSEDANEPNFMTNVADGTGLDTYGGISVKKSASFNGGMFDISYYFKKYKETLGHVTLATDGTRLKDADHSGDGSDLHLLDVDNSDVFGVRNFTIFACWRVKYQNAENNIGDSTRIGTDEGYINRNYNDTEQEVKAMIDGDDKLASTGNWHDYHFNENEQYDNKISYGDDAYIYYLAPVGQYATTLTLDIFETPDRDWNIGSEKDYNSYHGKQIGQLDLTFEWNAVYRRLIITSAVYNKFNFEYVITGSGINEIRRTDDTIIDILANSTYSTIKDENNQDRIVGLTYSQLIEYIASNITIETSKYKLTEEDTTPDINIGNSISGEYKKKASQETLKNSIAVEKYMKNHTKTSGEDVVSNPICDINIISIRFGNLRSFVRISADNEPQTYSVDFYRYIRPTDGMTTTFDTDSTSGTFATEYWDSEFINDWNQYDVYKRESYRYGEYVSRSYSYASNFAFDGWYYYEGHILSENYQEYDNNNADKIYYTYNSAGITSDLYLVDFIGDPTSSWETLSYNWDDAEHQYISSNNDVIEFEANVTNSETGYTTNSVGKLVDSNGNEISTIYKHIYHYNDDYARYQYNGSPIKNNTSIVAVYVPSSIHQAKYYIWNTSKYVERVDSSKEYVLGSKKHANVSDVPTDNGTRTFNAVEYWELGTNTTYYYVGFSGISKFSSDGGPAKQEAVAFLLQFTNSETLAKYNRQHAGDAIEYSYDEKGNLTISFNDLRKFVVSGVTFNGNDYPLGSTYSNASAETLADTLERRLIQTYSDFNNAKYSLYNNKGYLSDIKVLELMSFYHDIESSLNNSVTLLSECEVFRTALLTKDFESLKNTEKTINSWYAEIFGVAKYTVEEIDNQSEWGQIIDVDNFFAMVAEMENSAKEYIIAIVADHLNIEFNDIDEQLLDAIINKLSLKDLNMLLSNIAEDYFGYILRNPSSGIGNWPNDTYFAGWYLVDGDAAEYIINNSIVLTFNSDTWWGEYGQGDATHGKCFVIDNIIDENGYVTYEISLYKWNSDQAKYLPEVTFIVSKFRTVNALTGEIDLQSRVDNNKLIFAAFNRYKFEFSSYESQDAETGESITHYQVGEDDIQWGRINVPDVNGDPYQYRTSDVRYVVLDNEAKELYISELAKNNNMPTSLETVIETKGLQVYNSEDLQNLVDNLQPNEYIFAFVYNISKVTLRYYEDGTKEIIAITDSHINRVADNCLGYKDGQLAIVDTPQKANNSNPI